MFDYFKLLRKYNTLESKYESLKSDIKEDCFNKIINKLGEPLEIKRLREENKRLNKSLEEQRHFYLNQLQQKENIIKEVREYANNIMFETKAEEKIQDDILEILEKVD